MAVGQHQWYHFGVDDHPLYSILVGIGMFTGMVLKGNQKEATHDGGLFESNLCIDFSCRQVNARPWNMGVGAVKSTADLQLFMNHAPAAHCSIAWTLATRIQTPQSVPNTHPCGQNPSRTT